MKKTDVFKRIPSVVFCFVLVAAIALNITACGGKTTGGNESSEPYVLQDAKTVGEGKTEFSLSVTDANGKTESFNVKTDKETVCDALLDVGLIDGDAGDSFYVKKVNGITADYDVDGTYWAFYIDGNYAMTGVDATKAESGKKYGFKVEK